MDSSERRERYEGSVYTYTFAGRVGYAQRVSVSATRDPIVADTWDSAAVAKLPAARQQIEKIGQVRVSRISDDLSENNKNARR